MPKLIEKCLHVTIITSSDKDMNDERCSSSLCAHNKMCLLICAAGGHDTISKGTHLLVFLFLMKDHMIKELTWIGYRVIQILLL